MIELADIDVTITATMSELLALERRVHTMQIAIAEGIDIESIEAIICRRVLNAAVAALKTMKEAQ